MFSSSERFDMGSSRGEAYATDYDKNDKFSLKISTAFVLTLLAVAIAVCVGLIVHFAGGNKTVTCQCSCPGDGSNSGGQSGCPEQTTLPNTCTPCSNATQTPPVDMTTTEAPPSAPPQITDDVLLHTSLKPVHYNVVLRPNLYEDNSQHFTLNGSVRIYFNCIKSTNNITIHIQNLNVTDGSIVVRNMTDQQIPLHNYTRDDSARHFLAIRLGENLVAGMNYSVEMSFIGPLQNEDLSGLYYSSYMEDSQTRYMAITQFQPTDARKSFPSFDEPALKATFNITLERRNDTVSDMITLSNMPKIDTVQSTGGYFADIFEQTVVMPTYLLAFAVCDFPHKVNTTKYNHTFRTFARKEYIEHTNYSLWVGSRLLDEFEDYFEIEYPLPKLDMIAIPDFSAGAMENWGLVTYRESIMFYHPDISTVSQHIFTAIVVSHELAHMWFGNLISPKWWDDLWLNEGFATFFEYVGVDMVETDWDMMNYMALDCIQYSFDTDSLESSRPIYQQVWTPNDINNIFDVITYYKGASVIRMMWFFLGKENFRRGLRDYIKDREYGSAQHDDLWEALSDESKANGTNIDVRRVMDTWVEQKNYPIVTVSKTSTGFKLTQQRFLLRNTSQTNQTFLWEIPVTYTTNVHPDFEQDYRNITWMNTTDISIETAYINYSWIILNIQEYGYFRVNYDKAIWNRINEQLNQNHNIIHVVNRAALISDAWAFNKAGILDIETALHTLDYLNNETEYIPWGAAVKELAYLDRMLVSTPVYGNFERFMIDKVNKTFMEHQLNISINQSVQKILLQSSVASRACKYGIKSCADEASTIFNEWRDQIEEYIIAPDIRRTVLCTALRHGSSEDWDFLFSRYANSSSNDQRTYLDALSCSRDNWVLHRYLDYSIHIGDTTIRSQDARFAILAVASNPLGLQMTWRFVRSNWKYIVEDFGLDSYALNQIVFGMARLLYTDYDIAEVEKWNTEHLELANSLNGFEQGIETIRNNKAWVDHNYNAMAGWLQTNYPNKNL
ncbi:aminopeptidase N-like [Mytilus galloprovincialis]|uniref:aminopeptidase N-like n=1 Tax=Mytilus galloprovincialis TaxID=29158 RepID=UPI003F7CA12B